LPVSPRNHNTKRHSEYDKILGDDEEVQDWLRAANPSTREVRFRRLGLVCTQYKTTPKQLKTMTSKQAFRFLLRIKEDMEAQKKAPAYILSMVKIMKSFFIFADIPISKRISIRTAGKKEHVPSNDELKSFLAESRLRGKAAISLLSFSGVRPEVLGDQHGNDGLKISDLPELKISNGKAEFTRIPAVVGVRKEISKTDSAYLTFLNEEGCRNVTDYLNWRLTKGELRSDAPIITADPHRAKFGQHVARKNISALVRLAMRAAGHRDFRPYVLRDWFAYKLQDGLAENLIIDDWRKFWMGRKDIELTYTLDRGYLPQAVIDKMRDGYAKVAERFMNLEPTIITEKQVEDKVNERVYRSLLEGLTSMTPEEIAKTDLSKMTQQELRTRIAEDMITYLERMQKFDKQVVAELRAHGLPPLKKGETPEERLASLEAQMAALMKERESGRRRLASNKGT